MGMSAGIHVAVPMAVAILVTARAAYVLAREWSHESARHEQIRGLVDNRCPVCGYDLRATPVRCPECGSSAEQPAPSWRGRHAPQRPLRIRAPRLHASRAP